jgi:hypothetical protein
MVKTCEGFRVGGLNCKNRIRKEEKYCWCHKPRESDVVESAKTDGRNNFQARVNARIAMVAKDKRGMELPESDDELEAALAGVNARVASVIVKAVAKSRQKLIDDIVEGLREVKI